jgi:murein DD-endopeptidase MepM/ murein hydrolase activator NlpD
MAKKFLSLSFPHCARSDLTCPRKVIRCSGTVLVLGFLVLIAVLVDYATIDVTRAKYKGLLRKQRAEAHRRLRARSSSSETVKNFENARKLNVMAGLRSPEVIEELGIGDGDTSQFSSPVEDVVPAPAGGQSVSLQDAKALTEKARDVNKSLDVLAKYFETQTAQLASTPTIWPTIGWVSSAFAFRNDPFTGKRAFHYGLDIATSRNDRGHGRRHRALSR